MSKIEAVKNESLCRRAIFLVLILICSILSAKSQWIGTTRIDNTAFFLFSARAERFDLDLREWLAPVPGFDGVAAAWRPHPAFDAVQGTTGIEWRINGASHASEPVFTFTQGQTIAITLRNLMMPEHPLFGRPPAQCCVDGHPPLLPLAFHLTRNAATAAILVVALSLGVAGKAQAQSAPATATGAQRKAEAPSAQRGAEVTQRGSSSSIAARFDRQVGVEQGIGKRLLSTIRPQRNGPRRARSYSPAAAPSPPPRPSARDGACRGTG